MTSNLNEHRLGDICRLVKGSYSSTKTEPGQYPLVVTAAQRRTAATYDLTGPAVCIPLISSTGHGDAAIHRLHFQDGPFALANLLVALLPLEGSPADAEYLYWYLTAKKDDVLVPLMRGTANVSLKERDVADVVVPLPPLPEQRRIVARVKRLLDKVEEARAVREQTQTQLHDLIAAEERKIWPDEALAEAPLLEEVTDFLSRGRQSTQGESQHRLIKTQHVQMGQYVPTQARLSPEVAGKVKPEALVRQGDTLIACSAAGCLGRVAFYDDDSSIEASTDTHVAIARPSLDRVTPEYLYAYLKGAQGQYQLRSRERGDWQREKVGFRLTELNVADMRRIPIPTPSLERQREIVATLDSLRSRVTAITVSQAQTQRELDALPASILARAFAGAL